MSDPLNARATLTAGGKTYAYYRLAALGNRLALPLDRLPFTVKVLIENVLRNAGTEPFTVDDTVRLASWKPGQAASQAREFPFLPARVILQDFTGVPAVVDLASMRSAMARVGGDPSRINPLVPVDLVIDHSVQVDMFGTSGAFAFNVQKEYERNRERYTLLRWAQQAFHNFRVVPPGTGIVHQVNLEYLGKVVWTDARGGVTVAYPDTLVGTDSHTTMINGLGILAWGVGGIEAEAAMLGQPIYMLTPEVVGFRLIGEPPEGVTATDLVLTVAQILRKTGVVDKFVEFFGASLKHLSLPDRATIGNMSPEFGSTATMFPIDDETLRYMRLTGRGQQVALVEAYAKAQGLFRSDDGPDPEFDQVVTLDLSTLEPSLAGPRRPQDRVALPGIGASFHTAFDERISGASGGAGGGVAVAAKLRSVDVKMDGARAPLSDASVVIAAITSCTNTSNPAVMVAAGLLAKKAVEHGLTVPATVKTSLAPGSMVVTSYLERAGLMTYLETLRFHLVGYGCTTCIGNSGPLPDPVAQAVQENDLVVAAVLSGNRNFEGRIHPQVRASYLASPPLVVAFALAGTVDIDLTTQPIGRGRNGMPVFLRDIWPTSKEIQETVARSLGPEMFEERYRDVFHGDDTWRTLPVPAGGLYAWDRNSTYEQEPPFFTNLSMDPPPVRDIKGGRVLAVLGDSITTDHISPAGSIGAESPAGRYLMEHGVAKVDFNSYGSRRGNHEVLVRGTFANVRLRNALGAGKEGGWTTYLPTGEVMSIYDAAMRYQADGTPLIVIGGKEYGSGSSRDWAAKGPKLLGVRASIAESFERIHRTNLVQMGVLPLQFKPGENTQSLGLTGREVFDIEGIEKGITPGQTVTVRARGEGGPSVTFQATVRIDSGIEVEYYRHGGVLPFVLRRLMTHK